MVGRKSDEGWRSVASLPPYTSSGTRPLPPQRPPIPPRPAPPGRYDGGPTSTTGAAGSRPSILILAALLANGVMTAALLGVAAGHRRTAADFSPVNAVGWLLGAIVGLSIFAWFRSRDAARRTDANYVCPRWRPTTVGVVLALANLACALLHGWAMAEALARR